MLWIKAFHIIFMVCWFAGIFYLPRLFVYHSMATDPATQKHLELMENKLYRFMSLFPYLTVIFGLWLASYNVDYYLQAPWFHLKLFLVVLLVIYHITCGRIIRQLKEQPSIRPHTFYRWFNELPVLILFAVVILAVVKPF